MSDLSLFYSSMSSVLNQWSDFRVAKPLYKHYFAQQKAESESAAKEAASSLESRKTSSASKTSAYSASSNDKLKTYADNVTSSVTNLESAFKANADTGEIDRDKAYEAASKFVDSYNSLYEGTKGSGNATVSGKQQFISNMTNSYSRKLENVGISVGTDGKLSIDKDKFNAATEDELDEVFGKKNSFASFMSTQASAVSAYSQTEAYKAANQTYTSSGTVASSNSTALSGVLYNQLF